MDEEQADRSGMGGYITLPPRCSQCYAMGPNEIIDNASERTYQCRSCGHVWSPDLIHVHKWSITFEAERRAPATESIDPELERQIHERLMAAVFQLEVTTFYGATPTTSPVPTTLTPYERGVLNRYQDGYTPPNYRKKLR